MTEKTISALIEGGKATAGPPIGPALGPMGINAGQVVAEINEKTKNFAGITVPVKITVNTKTKEFRIEIGTPPVSSLIKAELQLKKASSKAKEIKAGSIKIDQIIKIMRMKQEALHGLTPQAKVKEIMGTCVSMGILVNDKDPRQVIREVNEGKFDAKILGKAELELPSQEEINAMKKRYEFKEEKKVEVAAPTEGEEAEEAGKKKIRGKALKAAVAAEQRVEKAKEEIEEEE